MKLFKIIVLLLIANISFSQTKFTPIINLETTTVKNQQRTGTCWSFATASFIESEVLRINKEPYDLSEMFVVRNIYENKAKNYFLRQGKANFSQGGLSHDFINAIASSGLVPQEAYAGKPKHEEVYNHTELFDVLNGYLKSAVASNQHTDYWFEGYNAILDVYLGRKPYSFTYEGQSYTPKKFAASLGIDPKKYIEFASVSHHPLHKYFVLEIPDNYSSGMYYNLKIDELKAQTDYALENGFTVSWDGDVSEPGFGRKSGIIALENESIADFNYFDISKKRKKQFESYSTTNDHLMHIIGKAKDEKGKLYYIVKNSWGNAGKYDGYYYMTDRYFLLKTVAIMVHRDAIMKDLKPIMFIQDAIY